MDFIKIFKGNMAIFSAGSVLLGAILMARSDLGERMVCLLLAALLLVGSASHFISGASSRRQKLPAGADLAIGFLMGVAAIFAAVQAQQIVGLIPMTMGGIFSINGAVKLQKSLQLKQMQYRGWSAVTFCALLAVGFGVVLLFNPFTVQTVAVRVLGIGFLFNGLSDLITMASVSWQVQKDMLSGVSQL